MLVERSSEETVVVATYSNWNEAEVARGFLKDEGIECVIVGQEPHRAPELTDGVRLRVLATKAQNAVGLLHDADLLPAMSSPEDAEQSRIAMKRLTIWTLAVIMGLILISILVNVF